MIRLKIALMIGAALVALGPIQTRAEAVPIIETITLSEAVRHTLDQYPAVKAATAEHEAARAAVGQAQAAWFPSLTLTGSATRYEKPMVVAPIHGLSFGQLPDFDRTLYQAGAHLNFTLFDGFGRSARIRQARSAAAAASAGSGGARQAAIAQTVSAYMAVLTKGELLAAHDKRLTAFAAEHDRVKRMLDVGKAADVDLMRIEAAQAAASADRVQAAEALKVAEHELARITGLAPEQTTYANLVSVNLTESELAERSQLTTAALESNPELESSRQQTRAAQAAAQVARSAHWPQLKLAASYLDFSSPDVDHEAEWNAGVQLTYPIFTGGAVSRASARANATARASAERERLTELNVSRQLDAAIAAVHESHAQVASLQRAVDRFAEVVRIEKLRLAAGAGTQSDYLDAEASLLSARAGLAAARHREIASRVEIARITGQLSLPWLNQIVEHTP